MRAVRALVAGLLTLLLGWSAVVSAPAAVAAPGGPVEYEVRCGYVIVENISAEAVWIGYGPDSSEYYDEDFFVLDPGKAAQIYSRHPDFSFDALDINENVLFRSPAFNLLDCPKVVAKTPKITGKARVGVTLTATTPGWAPAGVQVTYQWFRSGKTISGATAATYAVTGADKGKRITVKVTGSYRGETGSKTSKATAKVKAGSLAASKPVIEGLPVVGGTLTANPGAWGPEGVKLSYQWYRSGKKIKRATGASYVLTGSERGKKITVKVTGKLYGYSTASKKSGATAKVIVPA